MRYPPMNTSSSRLAQRRIDRALKRVESSNASREKLKEVQKLRWYSKRFGSGIMDMVQSRLERARNISGPLYDAVRADED